jgi:hypothetical protein
VTYIWVNEESTGRDALQITHGPEHQFLTRILSLRLLLLLCEMLEGMVGVVVDLEGREFLDRRRRLFGKVRPRR